MTEIIRICRKIIYFQILKVGLSKANKQSLLELQAQKAALASLVEQENSGTHLPLQEK